MEVSGKANGMDVLVLNTGRVYLDIIFGDVDRIPEAGEEIHYEKFSIQAGGAFSTAAGLAKLGLTTALVADLGDDHFSEFLFQEIKKVGIRQEYIRRVPGPVLAVSVSISNSRDRRFLSHVRKLTDLRLNPAEVVEIAARHLFLPGLAVMGNTKAIVKAAKEAGTKVSLDAQSQGLRIDKPPLADFLPHLEYLFCNDKEAMDLTGQASPEKAIEVLAGLVPCPVVKLGAEGAMTVVNGKLVKRPAPKVKPVDTTGAGDSFAAGFIYAVLADLDVSKALEVGNLCGAHSTTRLGSVASFPDLRQVRRFLGRVAGKK